MKLKSAAVGLVAALGLAWGALVQCPAAQAGFFDVTDAEQFMFRIEPRVWFSESSDIDGSFRDGNTTYSISEDLGSEVRFSPYIEFQFAQKNKIRGSYFRISKGETVTGNDLAVFTGGVPVAQPANAFASADLDLDVFEVGYQYDLLEGKWGFVAPFIEVAAVNYDVRARALYDSNFDGRIDTLDDTSESGTAPIPQLGLAARVYLHPRIALAGEIKGMSVGYYGSLLQFFIGPEVSIAQNLAINAGWRYLNVTADVGDADVEYTDHGPYVGVVVRF